jgi:alanine dehydrogenase
MKILDENAVRGLLQMDELIEVTASALAGFSSGKAVQPVRTVLSIADHNGFFGLMPAYNGALGAKLVTLYPDNKHLPTHQGVIVLFDPATGEPTAIVDGRLITEMRTAAASAVATRLLARAESSVLAILGSGVQARSHIEALRLVREFREVRVWSPRNARAFAESHRVKTAETAEQAVRGADVVVVATASTTPVLAGEWLSPGMHINAVGACRPSWRELDDAAMERANTYVDSIEAASVESGDVIAAKNMCGEIGEIIAGTKSGRQSDEEITLYKSVGIAVEDIAAADLVYRRASELKV